MQKEQIKRSEWNKQAVSTEDLCRQVCRTVDSVEFDMVIADIRYKLDIKGSLDAILDIGCGNGLVLSKFDKNFKHVHGVDFSLNMIEQAKMIVPHGHFDVCDANDLKFENSRFDRVLAHSIFHYFPDFDYALKVIKEMIRVCKKGGIVLIGDIPDNIFESKIKESSDLDYEKRIPLIQRYSEWKFFDLKKISGIFKSDGYIVEILPQPQNFKCAYYRKDLRIRI